MIASVDLSTQRSAWEHDKSAREQVMAESLTIDQKLADRRLDLSSIQARLNYLRPEASKAQSELDTALAERARVDAQRAVLEAQVKLLRQQLDMGKSQLLSLAGNQTRRRADVASLNDERGKLQLSVQAAGDRANPPAGSGSAARIHHQVTEPATRRHRT